MKTVLISIISEQTIPNLLLIKDLQGEYDEQIFLTTKLVAEKGFDCWIERAAGIDENTTKRLQIIEDNLNDIKTKLQTLNNSDNRYIVNITGGPKLVTIAVYEHFSQNPKNKIIYISIGKNSYQEIFPNILHQETIIKTRLNLKEYLNAYGLIVNCSFNFLKPKKFTLNFYNQFKQKNFFFLKESRIINSHSLDNIEDRIYFSGAWFEEYIYYTIKEDFSLSDEFIGLGVKLKREEKTSNPDNEYDIMFVYENQLYVVECKVSIGGNQTAKDNLEKFLYKLAAITRDFGLRTNSAVFTLTNLDFKMKTKMDWLEKRTKILGIKAVVDANFFMQNKNVKEIFNIN